MTEHDVANYELAFITQCDPSTHIYSYTNTHTIIKYSFIHTESQARMLTGLRNGLGDNSVHQQSHPPR